MGPMMADQVEMAIKLKTASQARMDNLVWMASRVEMGSQALTESDLMVDGQIRTNRQEEWTASYSWRWTS